MPNTSLRAVLLAPATVIALAFVVAPLVVTAVSSVRVSGAWTLDNFRTVFTTEPYLTVFATSFSIAVLTTIIAIVLAIPACAYFARQTTLATGVFLASVTLALTVSLLIRTYAWQVLLGYNGVFNDLALMLGIQSERIRLLYTKTAVLIVLVQVMLPYACLVIFTTMKNIDRDVILAARTLGAGPVTTFREAYWPQIKNSVIMAALIVFTGSAGSYVTPALIGGPGETMIGMQMQSDLVVNYLDGNGLAAASGTVLGLVLLVFSGLAFYATRKSFVLTSEQDS